MIAWMLLYSLQVYAANRIDPTEVGTANAVVDSCHDGDTCRMTVATKVVKVRFSGTDAPELRQAYGEAARDFLVGLIGGKTVRLQCKERSLGRENCAVFVEQLDVQDEMVKAGFAHDFPRFSGGKYRASEATARAAKLGLWAGENVSSPFCFRYPQNGECLKNPLFEP